MDYTGFIETRMFNSTEDNVRAPAPVTDFSVLEQKASAYLPAEKIKIVREAYDFAAKAHTGQMRKSGEPFLEHPVD